VKKHIPEGVIRLLREAQASADTVAEFCGRQGISEQAQYRWRRNHSGSDEDEAKRLNGLEVENAKLKKLLAEALMANETIKEVPAIKG
jgi:putative transposase